MSTTHFSSVQFSRSVVSDSLRPHESQHARAPCPSPTPGVHSKSRPSSLWCHPAISSSVIPFSSCPRSLPASESFPISQLSAWGGWIYVFVSFLKLSSDDILFYLIFHLFYFTCLFRLCRVFAAHVFCCTLRCMGSSFPDQGLNPDPLNWGHAPGRSLFLFLILSILHILECCY